MYFNPRTREGCDSSLSSAAMRSFRISIHAPVKGATHGPGKGRDFPLYFNPRTREGCDKGGKPTLAIDFPFQSTHP